MKTMAGDAITSPLAIHDWDERISNRSSGAISENISNSEYVLASLIKTISGSWNATNWRTDVDRLCHLGGLRNGLRSN